MDWNMEFLKLVKKIYRKLDQQYSYKKLLSYEDLLIFSTILEQWEQESGYKIKQWLERNSNFITHMRGGVAEAQVTLSNHSIL